MYKMIKNKKFIPVAIYLLLTACGADQAGTGEVGQQQDALPKANIEVVGVSKELKNTQVRSGTDVILSGQNSVGVDDPILYYQWKQTDNSGYPVVLYERSNNSVAFTTPALPADSTGVTLSFELTVIDADGVKAVDTTSVKVVPVADPNRYLVNPQVRESVRLYIAAPAGTSLPANLPATIRVKPVVLWKDRAGLERDLSLEEKEYSTILTSGAVGAILGQGTAFVTLPMPSLDVDEINRYFQGAQRLGRLEIENLDTARIEWQLNLQVSSSRSISVYLVDPSTEKLLDPQNILVTANSNLPASAILNNLMSTSARVDVEKLRQALNLESRLSAENYHKCIDPLNKATNFADWLNQAGFNAANAGDVHTKYINNYDLGFGRDMHIRTDQQGNVYSYVSNYNSLENTISNRNAFAIVVMEYSPAPTGNCGDGTFTDPATGKKIVKFFTYVPDELKGGYKRALSMNFDGRGEKYMPGSCTACHSGKTNADLFNSTTAIDAAAADLDSSFMPWDLDAFLYAHANDPRLIDPVYASFAKTTPPPAAVVTKYSREQQEALFKQQNQATLHTYTQDITKLKRYETAIKLIRGWYADATELANMDALNFGTPESPLSDDELQILQSKVKTLPAGNYNGKFVLAGWRQNAATEDFYLNVFNRYCRLCHVQMNKPQIDFDNYEEFIGHKQIADYVYNQGSMPLSRLTMDRFWQNFYSETSAAELLKTHLNQVKNANIDVNKVPGYPQAKIAEETHPELTADIFLNFDQWLGLDGSPSLFSESYKWKVNSNLVSQTPKLSMQAGTPGVQYQVVLETESNGFVSAPVSRRIKVNNYTPQFEGKLQASVNEGSSVEFNLLRGMCSDEPDSTNCRQYFGDIRAGQKPLIELEQSVVNGSVAWVDQAQDLIQFTSAAAARSGPGEFSFRLTDSFGERSDIIKAVIQVNELSAPTIGANDSCQVSAISSFNSGQFPVTMNSSACPNPLLNDQAAPGLTFSLQSVSSRSQAGGNVGMSNGLITYTPPAAFIGTDSFTYTIIDNSFSRKTATGTVTVNVSPTITFSSIASTLNANCTPCHTSNLAPRWAIYSNLVARLTVSAGASQSQLLNTRFFIYACSADNHTGGNTLCNTDLHETAPTSSSQINGIASDVLRWVEEGAQNN